MNLLVSLTGGTGTTIDYSVFTDAITAAITPEMLLGVLATTVGVGVGFFLMWFGVRKLMSTFTAALTKGKLKV